MVPLFFTPQVYVVILFFADPPLFMTFSLLCLASLFNTVCLFAVLFPHLHDNIS